jgi:hypothetical protein
MVPFTVGIILLRDCLRQELVLESILGKYSFVDANNTVSVVFRMDTPSKASAISYEGLGSL